jgi:hypothetical protein
MPNFRAERCQSCARLPFQDRRRVRLSSCSVDLSDLFERRKVSSSRAPMGVSWVCRASGLYLVSLMACR